MIFKYFSNCWITVHYCANDNLQNIAIYSVFTVYSYYVFFTFNLSPQSSLDHLIKSSLSFLNRVNAETKRHSKQQKLSARRHAREHQLELRMRSTTWNEVWTRYTTSTARTVSYRNYHGERRLLAQADRRPEVSSYGKSSGKLVKSAGCFLQLATLRPTNLCSR